MHYQNQQRKRFKFQVLLKFAQILPDYFLWFCMCCVGVPTFKKVLQAYRDCTEITLTKKQPNYPFESSYIQKNLVNSKSTGLWLLFRSIKSSKYREVDIQMYKSQYEYDQGFFYQAHALRISWRRFFYAHKTYVMGSN